jgi:hypothetical protein
MHKDFQVTKTTLRDLTADQSKALSEGYKDNQLTISGCPRTGCTCHPTIAPSEQQN